MKDSKLLMLASGLCVIDGGTSTLGLLCFLLRLCDWVKESWLSVCKLGISDWTLHRVCELRMSSRRLW